MALGIDCALLFSTTDTIGASSADIEAAYQNAVDPGINTVVTIPEGTAFSQTRFYVFRNGSLQQSGINVLNAASNDYFNSSLFYYVYPGYEVSGAVEAFTGLYKYPYDLTGLMYPDGYKTVFFRLSDGHVYSCSVNVDVQGRDNSGNWSYVDPVVPLIIFGKNLDPYKSWPSIAVAGADSAYVLSSLSYAATEQNNAIYLVRQGYPPVDWEDWEEGKTPPPPDTDPYGPGGGSDTGGGDGTFDDTSVPVDVPALPTLSAVDTGFITLFNPSLSELLSLASYMWSSFFDVSTFKKLFADPMECILGLSIVPVAVPDGGPGVVKVGNISTGITMNRAASQYVTVDCGSLQIQEYWGGYLDYAPFTSAEIYLPYIGTHPLALDDIMGKTVHVVYHVDILSGACCAYVLCDGTVLYSFIGQCSSSIPVSGKDFTNVINGVLGIAGAIGTMVATGGASAPTSAVKIASNAVNALKPQVEKSGAMSGTGGLLGVQVPYIILTRPRQALPAGQNALMGYPAFITRTLGSLSGYTEVESIHLEGIPCTSEEITEIETLLGQGVIL